MTPDVLGIEDGYLDAGGVWRATSAETRSALLAAMGADPGTEAEEPGRVEIVRAGRAKPLPGPAELTLEDGVVLRAENWLPPDLPVGYHDLRLLNDARPHRLIVSPGTCYLQEELRTWGWTVQLYALRSRASWGIGDLADLRRLARWSAEEFGEGVLLVNPLHAPMPLLPQQPSPYFPSTRRYRNPLYLRIEEVPGAAAAGQILDRLAASGRALNGERLIDRDAVFRLKMEGLRFLWTRFRAHPRFDRYCREQGDALVQFATFCALAEHHGSGWQRWPSEYRHPASPAVARFATDRADQVRFHQWVQWLLDEQLARVAAQGRIIQDLPIGFDPDGADAWMWQDLLARDLSIGAPPDEYNTRGQNWGLPAFVPRKLRAAAYEPFVRTIRGTLRHAAGLRIDHIMGLFRLFWIRNGASPAEGAFVRYPADDLLAILAVESHRARAVVVGEDLGTVEVGARERLADAGILRYRVLWFEADPPARYPKLSLAAVTTHDLPTLAGLWSGADIGHQRALGLSPNEEGTRAMRARLRAIAGLSDDAGVEEVILRAYRLLADAPSVIATATLEDALAVEDRPNMPATSLDQWPNWSIALPASLEAIETHPLARAIGATLARRAAGT